MMVRTMVRVYTAMARRLLPRAFLLEYGAEVERVIEERLQGTSGGLRRVAVFVREVADLIRTGAREWGDELSRPRDIGGAGHVAEAGRARLGDALGQDLRLAIRQVVRTPGFTALAIVMIGMGVGPSTAVYSIVQQVILTPLPFEDPDELVMIWPHSTGEERVRRHLSPANIASLREGYFVSALEGVNTSGASVTGLGQAEFVVAARVTGGLMAPLGERPLMGRDLVHADADIDADRVVVVSHRFWQSRLNGDPDVVGTFVDLAEEPHRIVGVAPPGFDYPEESLLWTPMRVDLDQCGRNCAVIERALGRLAPGVTLQDAEAGVDAVATRLAETDPDDFPDDRSYWVESMIDYEVDGVRTGLLLTLGAVGLVLLIVCANTANLLLTRAIARQKEIALRAALGASRWRLVSQVVAESAVLAAGGAAMGALLAVGIVRWVRVFAADMIPRGGDVVVDASALLTLVAITALAAVGFGLLPALRVRRTSTLEVLVRSAQSVGTKAGARVRAIVLAGEVALCVIALAWAGLLLTTLHHLDDVDMGFDGAQVTRFTMVPPVGRYPERADLLRLVAAVEGEIGRVPGVEAVGSVFGAPLTTDRLGVRASVHDGSVGDGSVGEGAADGRIVVEYRPATPGYFEAMRIPLLRGRGLRGGGGSGPGPADAVVNEVAARALFGDEEDFLGREVRVESVLMGESSMRIVGVVGDVRRNITGEAALGVYPLYEALDPAWRGLVVHARTRGELRDATREIRDAVARVDADLVVALAGTVAEARGRESRRIRIFGALLGGFALMAVFLAAIGLYGVVAFVVGQRRSEIGLRIALGAGRRSVTTLVLTQGLGYSVLGLVVGLGAVAFGGRVIEALLFGVTASDPVVLGGVAIMVTGVAAVASLAPLRAAMRVDPSVALRAE